MKAKIKSFQSPDIENLFKFVPSDPENFSFLLELLVGPDNEEGEESFNIQICTPYWLLSKMKKEDVLFGNYFVIVLEYNFDRIFSKIKRLVESCNGANWDEVANKVSRIGHWEFDNYTD